MAETKHDPAELTMREPWHLKREVSIGHILTTVTVLGAMGVYMAQTEARLATLESNQGYIADRLDRDEVRNASVFGEIKNALIRIETKLDGKADKR